MRLVQLLLKMRQSRWFPARLSEQLLLLIGLDLPRSVQLGTNVCIHHRGIGVVVHSLTRIGNNVHVYQHVTLGRANGWVPFTGKVDRLFTIEDDVWLFAGAVLLATEEHPLTVGRGTVVGANSVLTRSTGEWEIWAGAPARCIGSRPVS